MVTRNQTDPTRSTPPTTHSTFTAITHIAGLGGGPHGVRRGRFKLCLTAYSTEGAERGPLTQELRQFSVSCVALQALPEGLLQALLEGFRSKASKPFRKASLFKKFTALAAEKERLPLKKALFIYQFIKWCRFKKLWLGDKIINQFLFMSGWLTIVKFWC